MAIIVRKDPEGKPTFKSVTFPPTDEELQRAKELDRLLRRRVGEIERKLVLEGLLAREIPRKGEPAKGGNVRLWYQLGRHLQLIADDSTRVKPAERRWLWEAIRMYATPRITRRDRGVSRLHLDYCYRVAKLPWDCVRRFHWDDWVYLLDSRSFRGEPRADLWIQSRVNELKRLTREQLRTTVQRLNVTFRRKETSIYSDEELLSRYDEALAAVMASPPGSLKRPRAPKASSSPT